MGHENVGYLARVGRKFAEHKGVKEGDLMFLEHYLPCGHCEWDHMGEYRHCAATEWFYDPTAIRYGYTSIDTAPSLWGGFSQYLYLPLNAVLHKIPEGLTPEQAGIATPMSNGVQWAVMDGGVGLRVHGPDPGTRAAGIVLRHGLQTGGRRPHHRHRHVQGCEASRGCEGARRRRGDRRRRRRIRSRGFSTSPPSAASTLPSTAPARAWPRRCSGSKRRSAVARRWCFRRRATRGSRISPSARSPGRA